MTMEARRAVVRDPGGPEAIAWEDATLPDPGAGEVAIRQEAVSVDLIDTLLRAGQMPAEAPFGLGFSAAGTIAAIGEGVGDLSPGDPVAYSWATPGSYATARIVPAERVVRRDAPALGADIAAGALFRGLTAWYLARRLRSLGPGDTVLVHAAAGGVGQILVQWLRHLGASVIGVTGTPDKREVVERIGADHALVDGDGLAREVARITGGRGCAVVYDSVGRDTIARSIDCAARFGLLVSFGWSSGDFDTVSLPALRNKGSLFVTRPTIAHYTAETQDLRTGAAELFALIESGAIALDIAHRYPLERAAEAHAALSSRSTRGPVILEVERAR